ncbi:tetratricopeptide repeat protein, partial [Nonomuraea rhizosphaerae]|uniref:tetratricopeptide repeat protein n=1 Tax=Nonomuraea rhizosphaerae TaxID=2665663 RepID=UPI001C5F515F
MSSHNRAASAWTQFERSGSLADLDAAISAHRQAVETAPNKDRDHALLLNNLGIALRARYELTGNVNDLEQAIVPIARALDLITVDNPRRPAILNHLGSRLPVTGRLAEAETVTRQAVDIYRELAAANRDAYLPDLAASLSNHAALLAEVGRRAEAVPVSEQAVELRRQLA